MQFSLYSDYEQNHVWLILNNHLYNFEFKTRREKREILKIIKKILNNNSTCLLYISSKEYGDIAKEVLKIKYSNKGQ